PFGGRGGSPGLATSVRSTAAASVWRIRLRGRVRFQDGARFDAAAVLANAARWQALDPPDSPAAELLGADSPKPGLVRFILDGSDPSFDAALGSSKLGIVSPRAIRDDGSIAPLEPSGTGPFELREREFDRLLLARNIEWWGTRRDLGPGFDQIEIELDASDAGRADSLLAGEVMLADELPAAEARRLGRDPLLVGLTVGGGEITGLERSVRGIESIREAPSLAGAWLTRLEPG
nr:hypothetical protein [Solirubrobacterales bacterium]